MSLVFDALQRLESERAETEWPPMREADEFLRCVERRAAANQESASEYADEEGLRSHPESFSSSAAPDMPAPALPALRAPMEDSRFELPSGVRRAVAVLRVALPVVESVLQLLDGKPGAAGSSLLAPPPDAPPPAAPLPARVDILGSSLVELKTRQGELLVHNAEQNASLQRVADRLAMVREATNRNTLVLQEMIEDLKGVGKKFNLVALTALGLLAVTVGFELVLYLRIVKVIH